MKVANMANVYGFGMSQRGGSEMARTIQESTDPVVGLELPDTPKTQEVKQKILNGTGSFRDFRSIGVITHFPDYEGIFSVCKKKNIDIVFLDDPQIVRKELYTQQQFRSYLPNFENPVLHLLDEVYSQKEQYAVDKLKPFLKKSGNIIIGMGHLHIANVVVKLTNPESMDQGLHTPTGTFYLDESQITKESELILRYRSRPILLTV